MDRKYQIFISSTYEDLKEQRDAVVKAVLKMGHLPVGMEMFNAADQQQWEIIKRHIDNSDYYVLIVANRYGTIGPQGISFTQQEYKYAVEKQIPCLGFILQKGTLWPDTMMEVGTAKKKLDAFKNKVRERPVNFWDSTDNLALQVFASLSEAITLNQRPGWVRATEAASPQVAEELARLSKENEELRSELAKVSASDETQELGQILENTSLPVGSSVEKLKLSALFYSVCKHQQSPTIYQFLEELKQNFASVDERELMGVIHDGLKELLLLNLVERFAGTQWQEWRVTDKGKQLYKKSQYS